MEKSKQAKLVLRKETLRRLTVDEMQRVVGSDVPDSANGACTHSFAAAYGCVPKISPNGK